MLQCRVADHRYLDYLKVNHKYQQLISLRIILSGKIGFKCAVVINQIQTGMNQTLKIAEERIVI